MREPSTSARHSGASITQVRPHIGSSIGALDFRIALRLDGGAPQLALGGELDVATARLLAPLLTTLIDDGHLPEIDLAALSFIDAAGLRTLCEGAARLSCTGRRLPLRAACPSIERILRLAEAQHYFDLEEGREPRQEAGGRTSPP